MKLIFKLSTRGVVDVSHLVFIDLPIDQFILFLLDSRVAKPDSELQQIGARDCWSAALNRVNMISKIHFFEF